MKRVLLLLLGFFPFSAAAQDGHVYNFTMVNGNDIAWSCEGDGSPVIALIAGGGLDAHTSFSRTYHNYDGPGTICMYERAGMGKSTFENPRTRSLHEISEELYQLSTRESWEKMLLVAHSFGGFIARQLASDHPETVSGILMLDVAQEDWIPNLQQSMLPEDWAVMESILEWNTETFHEDYLQAQEAVRKTTLKPDLPLTIVARGIPHTTLRSAKVSYDGVRKYNAEHNAGQLKLQELSSNSRFVISEMSSHFIDNYDPWLVIEEIKLLLERTSQ